jgi:peroxiredoxin
MARANGFILDTGASFPRIAFTTVSGEQVVLPRDVKGRWSVLLFYRGDW